MAGIKTEYIEFGSHTFGCTEISEPRGHRDVFCTADIEGELIGGRGAPSTSQPVKVGDLQQ
jgi:hypothetical protein